MPSLNVAFVLRIISASSTPSARLRVRICGSVASPTPTMPISSDSISRTDARPGGMKDASTAAVVQPAVPPPRITTLTGLGIPGDSPAVHVGDLSKSNRRVTRPLHRPALPAGPPPQAELGEE